jgi:hypothetical protein
MDSVGLALLGGASGIGEIELGPETKCDRDSRVPLE